MMIFKLNDLIKIKKFDEIRRDIYFRMHQDWCHNVTKKLIDSYVSSKNQSKELNTAVHKLFRKYTTLKIKQILEQYNIVKINKINSSFNIELNKGRFICYDGNSIQFLGEDTNFFYLISWHCS
jgi:hypothetical protein